LALIFLFLFTLAAPLSTLAAPPRGAKSPAASATAPASAAPAATDSDIATPPAGDPAAPPADMLRWKPGPVKVALGHELDLDLPEAYVFLGMPDAAKLLEKLGNFHNEDLLGVVVSKQETADWLVTIRYDDAGF